MIFAALAGSISSTIGYSASPSSMRAWSGVALGSCCASSATPDQARMLLGEALYPMVDEIEPASAAKITGMLLEMDQGEVLLLIEDNGALRAKVQEALAVLKAAAAEEGN